LGANIFFAAHVEPSLKWMEFAATKMIARSVLSLVPIFNLVLDPLDFLDWLFEVTDLTFRMDVVKGIKFEVKKWKIFGGALGGGLELEVSDERVHFKGKHLTVVVSQTEFEIWNFFLGDFEINLAPVLEFKGRALVDVEKVRMEVATKLSLVGLFFFDQSVSISEDGLFLTIDIKLWKVLFVDVWFWLYMVSFGLLILGVPCLCFAQMSVQIGAMGFESWGVCFYKANYWQG
jgi:hypothetical protein